MTASIVHDAERVKNTIIAILLTCVAYGYFNIGDAAIKIIARKFHFWQILFMNCMLMIVFMVLYGLVTQGRKAFKMKNPKWIAVRALFATATSLCNIVALPHVRLTTFYTLIFTSPFWIALLSAIFLKEKITGKRLGVIALGFAVTLYILRPGGALFGNVWSYLVLLSAFCYSCSMILMRYMGSLESRVMIICAGSACGALVCLPFLPDVFIMPNLQDWGVFTLLGLLGAIGITCIAYAFQTAPSAAVVAPFHYTQMVWGALLGLYLFDEMPDMPTLTGGAALIALGLVLIYLETRIPLKSRQPFQESGWFSRLRAYIPPPKQR